MSSARKGIRILGLSLLTALAAMAFTAGAAQAIEFSLSSKTFTADGVASETFLGSAGSGALITAESKLEFHCTTGAVTGTVLLGGTVHAHVLFNGCAVVGNKLCVIYPTAADRTANTNAEKILAEGLGEVILHGSVYWAKFSSASFSTIFLSKKACTLPPENVVSGSAAFKLPSATTSSLNHTVETINATDETLLGVALKYGTEKANLAAGTTGSIMLNTDPLWAVQ